MHFPVLQTNIGVVGDGRRASGDEVKKGHGERGMGHAVLFTSQHGHLSVVMNLALC